MGLELDLSELAALQPIRTAVRGPRAMAPALEDDGGECAAAETGCCAVTPTRASGASVATRRDGGVDDDDTGCVRPRRDGSEGAGAADTGCATPTSAASVLRPATVCPPAPRKPMPAKRKRRGRPTGTAPPPAPAPRQRFFFPVPHDLATVFVARVAASPPPCPPAKKIRLHVVG